MPVAETCDVALSTEAINTNCQLSSAIQGSLFESPPNAIDSALGSYSYFRIKDHTSGDIAKYVSESFHKAFRNIYLGGTEIKATLSLGMKIVEEAQGLFIWAKLVVNELIIAIESGKSADELGEILDGLPSELEDLYTRIAEKIPRKQRHHAYNYLQLLVNPEFGISHLIRDGPCYEASS